MEVDGERENHGRIDSLTFYMNPFVEILQKKKVQAFLPALHVSH